MKALVWKATSFFAIVAVLYGEAVVLAWAFGRYL